MYSACLVAKRVFHKILRSVDVKQFLEALPNPDRMLGYDTRFSTCPRIPASIRDIYLLEVRDSGSSGSVPHSLIHGGRGAEFLDAILSAGGIRTVHRTDLSIRLTYTEGLRNTFHRMPPGPNAGTKTVLLSTFEYNDRGESLVREPLTVKRTREFLDAFSASLARSPYRLHAALLGIRVEGEGHQIAVFPALNDYMICNSWGVPCKFGLQNITLYVRDEAGAVAEDAVIQLTTVVAPRTLSNL